MIAVDKARISSQGGGGVNISGGGHLKKFVYYVFGFPY